MSRLSHRVLGLLTLLAGFAAGCADISYPTRIDIPRSNRSPEEERVYRLEKAIEKERKEQASLREDIAKLEKKLNVR